MPEKVTYMHLCKVYNIQCIFLHGQLGYFFLSAKVPYFGICLGMQTALIEGARNLLGLSDANSEEFDPDSLNKGTRIG